jgi:hypothetical protein
MELGELYLEIEKILRKTQKDTSTRGMWNAEEIKKSPVATFFMYDGGYTSKINSEKYNFEMHSRYTNIEGSVVKLIKGKKEDVEACLNELKK